MKPPAPTRRQFVKAGSALAAGSAWPVDSKSSVERLAPDFDLPIWDGHPEPRRRLRLSSMRGRWIYVDFWASWCAPCKLSFPWMSALSDELSSRPFSVLAIGLDTRLEPATRFLTSHKFNFTVLWDAQQATPMAYAVKAMPSSFLIDPELKIVWSHRGFSKDSSPGMRMAVVSRVGLP